MHQDRLFDYGYLGKFETYRMNSYDLPTVDKPYFEQNGWVDTLVTFEASDLNPDVAAITDQYFQLFDQAPTTRSTRLRRTARTRTSMPSRADKVC